MQNIPKKDIRSIIDYDDPDALELLEQMLVFNPNKRISIQDAINSKYISQIKEGIVDPVFTGNLNLNFDQKRYDNFDELYNIFLNEINCFETGVIM